MKTPKQIRNEGQTGFRKGLKKEIKKEKRGFKGLMEKVLSI